MYNDNSIETFTDTSFTSSKLNAIDYSIDSEITENKFITNKITYLNNPTSSYSSYYNKYKILTDIILENEIEMKNRTELIQNKINNLFTKLIISDIDSGKSEKIYEKNLLIIITSTKHQKNSEKENMITIDLGKCENILKDEYNISKNNSLYILQLIYEEIGMKIPKVEYEVYYPLHNNNTLIKLNLSLCERTKIEISIPIRINDILDKYNPKSAYYNDICYKATSNYGTDLNLKDRIYEFIENNMTLCEEKCDLIDYNYNKGKVKCSCEIKTKISPNYDAKFNKQEFFKSFTDIKNIANLNILKCYKIVLSKNLIYNRGFYIMIFIFLLYFITIFIFWFKSYKKLKNDDILNIYAKLKKIKSIEDKHIIEGDKNKFELIKSRKKRKYNNITNKKSRDNFRNNINNKIYTNNVKLTQDSYNKLLTKLTKKNIVKFKSYDINSIYEREFFEKKDFEINSLEYEEAFKLDKRNFFQYYISLLKYNHPLIFSFGTYNDYNFRIIKIFLFFFSFSSEFAINALFFNDDTMHKIYIDKGKYNLLYQIPPILYSSLISRLIDSLMKNLSLSQDNIVEFKQEKEKNNLVKKFKRLLKIIIIKIKLFFVISFFILSFYWYYIICFCGIYVNTQIHLIKDTISSLITSLIYPFGIYLIPCIFRVSTLRMEIPSGKYLYKFSSFLENYIV